MAAKLVDHPNCSVRHTLAQIAASMASTNDPRVIELLEVLAKDEARPVRVIADRALRER